MNISLVTLELHLDPDYKKWFWLATLHSDKFTTTLESEGYFDTFEAAFKDFQECNQ